MKYFSNTAAKKVLVLVSPCGLMKAHQKWLWASSAGKTLQELRGLCELEALSAILFVPLFLFLQIPVLSFPSLPSASVPNAVVEGTKCGWDAVRRANAHLPFHNMPCDFCVDYVKKKGGWGVISAFHTFQTSAWHWERSCPWSQQHSTLLLPFSCPFLFSFALLSINILQTPFALVG